MVAKLFESEDEADEVSKANERGRWGLDDNLINSIDFKIAIFKINWIVWNMTINKNTS